jgi:hypothetical protein
VPAAVGVKVNPKLHEAPAAREPTHAFAESAAKTALPELCTLLMSSVAFPQFLMVNEPWPVDPTCVLCAVPPDEHMEGPGVVGSITAAKP